MNTSVKKFIQENKKLIAADDFEALYKKAAITQKRELSEVLLNAGINPLDYLDEVPDFFLLDSRVESFTIPNHITSIGDRAFAGCGYLTSIDIPNSVTSIGERAFYNCIKLTSVTIPNGVKIIEYAAFAQCSELTSITIPNSVTGVGTFAFFGCSKLTSVVIPDSVTWIGTDAFEDCFGLTSVSIGKGVKSIGDSAFYDCNKLTSITFNGTKEQWKEIGKDENWKKYVPRNCKVYCADGSMQISRG